MPRKALYSREHIVNSAYDIVRKKGAEYLSTRNIAKALGTSTAPLFTAFSGIEEVRDLVKKKAEEFYRKEYFEKALEIKPVFKNIGMNFVKFAKDEPELFKLIFMQESDESCGGFMPFSFSNSDDVLNIISNVYSLDMKDAKDLYNNLSVFTYGLAALYAHKSYIFDMDDVSRMLTSAFRAFLNDRRAQNDT